MTITFPITDFKHWLTATDYVAQTTRWAYTEDRMVTSLWEPIRYPVNRVNRGVIEFCRWAYRMVAPQYWYPFMPGEQLVHIYFIPKWPAGYYRYIAFQTYLGEGRWRYSSPVMTILMPSCPPVGVGDLSITTAPPDDPPPNPTVYLDIDASNEAP